MFKESNGLKEKGIRKRKKKTKVKSREVENHFL